MDSANTSTKPQRIRGTVLDAFIFNPDLEMCLVFFLSSSSWKGEGRVVPSLYDSFFDDENLAKLLRANSRPQGAVTEITYAGGGQIASVDSGTILKLDLEALAETKGVDFSLFAGKNIKPLKWVLLNGKNRPEIEALIYWPKK